VRSAGGGGTVWTRAEARKKDAHEAVEDGCIEYRRVKDGREQWWRPGVNVCGSIEEENWRRQKARTIVSNRRKRYRLRRYRGDVVESEKSMVEWIESVVL
jgi:hypothetical protein